MIQSANGVILRTRPLTETSLIVNWLTAESGRLSTVARGARRPKSPFAGKLDLFYEASFSFQRSLRSDLHTLREVSLRSPHAELRRELGWVQQAGYAAALIEQTTESETPLPELYELFSGFLNHLPRHAPKPRNVFAFELKLLKILGLEPNAPETNLPKATRELLVALTESEWTQVMDLRATSVQAGQLQRFLHGFLIYHLGKIPKGRHQALVS